MIVSISAEENHFPQGPCNTTLAEFTLDDENLDSYDVSLVNGQNLNMTIQADTSNKPIILNSSNLNVIKNTYGVYPPGCSRCVDGIGIPPAWAGEPQKNTQNCPGYGLTPGPMPQGSCKSGNEMDPKPNGCQVTSQSTGATYTVIFSDKRP
ncbi:thaumatin family protein [uncultured Legionella sp.]|uniref:thaumatin family protein n=1 Tax=uncultured Legionella sp. TaxID=210934 RepID=UPI0026348519|nr:thaumatin family protein [uncultured Legionella sp.]